MNTQQLSKNKKTEIYSISGFRDTLASPVFYPVIVVAVVLGITSIFGFVQNPLKLKSMVNVIHQKVATNESNVVSDSSYGKLYSMSKQSQMLNTSNPTLSIKAFELFTDIDAGDKSDGFQKLPVDASIERIVFNYDVTSENFWTDLDSSSLETATEEMERKEREAVTIGTPLEIDHRENLPAKFDLKDEIIYALGSSNKI